MIDLAAKDVGIAVRDALEQQAAKVFPIVVEWKILPDKRVIFTKRI